MPWVPSKLPVTDDEIVFEATEEKKVTDAEGLKFQNMHVREDGTDLSQFLSSSLRFESSCC